MADESTLRDHVEDLMIELGQARAEIGRLRRMATNLIGELKHNANYKAYTPEMLFDEFYNEARDGN